MAAFAVGCTVRANAAQRLIQRGIIEIAYSERDEAVARKSAEILEKAIVEFSEHLPAGDEPIRVVLCSSLEEFRQLTGPFGKARVTGVAKSEQGLIFVKAPRLTPPDHDFRGTLRHELVHVLVARNTDLANVPRWFNEGIAMVVSKELRWSSTMRVVRMYARRRLIPYPELNFAFAPLGNETVFGDAYAQALSMTRFLIDRVGEETFWDIVHAMKTMSFEEALRLHAGMTPGGLYDSWRRTLWKLALIGSLMSGFTLFQFMAFLLVVAYLRKRQRGRRILRQWEEEDAAEQLEWDALEYDPSRLSDDEGDDNPEEDY